MDRVEPLSPIGWHRNSTLIILMSARALRAWGATSEPPYLRKRQSRLRRNGNPRIRSPSRACPPRPSRRPSLHSEGAASRSSTRAPSRERGPRPDNGRRWAVARRASSGGQRLRGQGRHPRVPGFRRRGGHRQRAGAARPVGEQAPPKGLRLVGAVVFEGAQPPYPALSPGPSSRPARGAYRRGHRHVRGPVQHDTEQEAVADSGAGRVRRTGGLNAAAHRRVRGKALRYGCAILLWAVAAPSLSWRMQSRGTGAGTVEVPGLDAEKRSLSSSGTRRSGCPRVRSPLWS